MAKRLTEPQTQMVVGKAKEFGDTDWLTGSLGKTNDVLNLGVERYSNKKKQ